MRTYLWERATTINQPRSAALANPLSPSVDHSYASVRYSYNSSKWSPDWRLSHVRGFTTLLFGQLLSASYMIGSFSAIKAGRNPHGCAMTRISRAFLPRVFIEIVRPTFASSSSCLLSAPRGFEPELFYKFGWAQFHWSLAHRMCSGGPPNWDP